MSTVKKSQSLSFSVKEFLSHYPPLTKYLTYYFPSFSVMGKQFITFQLIYQELNTNDVQIQLEQSLDNFNYDDIVDDNGNPLIMTLQSNQTSVTITIAFINTAYIRCKLMLNNNTSGSFTNFIYLTN